MSRILFAGMLAIPLMLTGCAITPLGPMKNVFPPKAVEDVAPEPIVQKAPRPTPPAMLVTPGEVTETNYSQVVEKLKQELEHDRRTLESMPKTSEVSFVKGRQ